MQVNSGNYSISELMQMLDRRDLVINRDYQRASGLWPVGARSYFIDTILEGFNFPKIYLYEYISRPDGTMKKELVDGQQRLLTIRDFIDGKFTLVGDTKFLGMKFQDLDEEDRMNFLSYAVSADVIRNAQRSEILQMFRRMNAYTLPLNEAEKRHSTFYGEFKWYINSLSDSISSFFSEYHVFTNRQIVRMADAEFLADCTLFLERGVISTSPSDLRGIYKKYDKEFPNAIEYSEKIKEAISFIVDNFEHLKSTHMMKPYALQTLLMCLICNRFGIEAVGQQIQVENRAQFTNNVGYSAERLLELAQAHEAKETDGPHSLYVWGCSAGTNRAGRRLARTISILSALGHDEIRVLDNELAGQLPN